MNTLLLNENLVKKIMSELHSRGVRELCICPGKRNAPFIAVAVANPELFRTYYFYEERCAAFFALGRIKNTERPVAVITTSGTAAGELLPAAMEAYYSGLPLVLVTADRPRKYRGSGAPQTAEQVGLFGIYASCSLDLESVEDLPTLLPLKRTVHINSCFDEPLIEESDSSRYELKGLSAALSKEKLHLEGSGFSLRSASQVPDFLEQTQRPVAVVGALPQDARDSVAELLVEWGVPTYFEALSGLRDDPRLAGLRIHNGDQLFERAARSDYPFDGLVRIGGVPTLRLWRDLEGKYSDLPVLSLNCLPFSGLGRKSEMMEGPLDQICDYLREKVKGLGLQSRPQSSVTCLQRYLEQERDWKKRLDLLLEEEPKSEPGLLAALSRRIPSGSRVFLGNSLPIREWDLAATTTDRDLEIWGSRGLNGIDGQISTFFGFAGSGAGAAAGAGLRAENWGIIGDLTALYDLPAPWILSQLPELAVNLVVVNNGGGKIFSQMYKLPEFQNQHDIRFQAWAELWKMRYEAWNEVPQSIGTSSGAGTNRIIELLPSEEATQRFWKKYRTL